MTRFEHKSVLRYVNTYNQTNYSKWQLLSKLNIVFEYVSLKGVPYFWNLFANLMPMYYSNKFVISPANIYATAVFVNYV